MADTPENGLNDKKTTPGSKTRKRKRDLKEKMAQLASEGQASTPMYKRSSTEMLKISFNNGSFLDATVDTSAGTPLSGEKGINLGMYDMNVASVWCVIQTYWEEC